MTGQTNGCQIVVENETTKEWVYYIHVNPVLTSGSVKVGDVIATVAPKTGTGGCGYDPHLHFAVWRGAREIPIHFKDVPSLTSNGRTCPAGLICPSHGIDNHPYWVEFLYEKKEIALPPNQNIVVNGDFSTNILEPGWWKWGDAEYAFYGSTLAFKRKTNGTGGAIGQTWSGYSIPVNSPLELTLQLGNASNVIKNPGVIIKSGDKWDIVCHFLIPPNTPLQTYIVRGKNLSNWNGLNIEVWPDPPDGNPDVLMDNVTLKYIPDMVISGTECIAPSTNNPVPSVSSLSPAKANVGSGDLTLTVNGSNFVRSSKVHLTKTNQVLTYELLGVNVLWNVADLTTTYISPTQLTAIIPAALLGNSASANLTVINPMPGGGGSNAIPFTISVPSNPIPSVSTLSPSIANVGSGDLTLTVNGSNFVSRSKIRWNSTDLVTTYLSKTQLTALLPASQLATAGNAKIAVFNPAPGGGVSLALTFTIQDANPSPSITSLSSASALISRGDLLLTVSGSNFINASKVHWNESDLATTFINATQLNALVPASKFIAPGNSTVTVFNPTPGGGVSSPLGFITSTPPGSVVVNALGSGFESTWVGSWVKIKGYRQSTLACASSIDPIVTWTRNPNKTGDSSWARWRPVLPASGMYRVSVFIPNYALDDGTNIPTSQAKYKVNHAKGQTIVTVNQNTNKCGWVDLGSYQFNAGAGGNVFMGDYTGDRTWQVISADAAMFVLENNPVPALTSLSPDKTTARSEDLTVTINGSSFMYNSKVRWNGVDLVTNFVSATQLTVNIPALQLANAGSASLTIFNPTPGGGVSNAIPFTITIPNNPVPIIMSVSPNRAIAGSGDLTLTVNGSNFVSGSKVRWNGVDLATIYASATQLTATISAALLPTASIASVTVFNPAPGGGVSSVLQFTITPPAPVTCSILFGQFCAEYYDNRALTGIPFLIQNSANIDFAWEFSGPGGGIIKDNFSARWQGSFPFENSTYTFSVIGDDGIRLYVDNVLLINEWRDQGQTTFKKDILLSSGNHTIKVEYYENSGGARAQASWLKKTVTISNPVPVANSLSPASSIGSQDLVITVEGSNFVNGSKVRWNGVDLATTFVSATKLTAFIPAAELTTSGWANVTVFNSSPGGGSSSELLFTINPPNNLMPDTTKPDGNITAPVDGNVIQSSPIIFNADAWDNPDGMGVKMVEFNIYYSTEWHLAGTDNSAPYSIQWSIPKGLLNQDLAFAIHVIDNANNEIIDAGGYRHMIYHASPQNALAGQIDTYLASKNSPMAGMGSSFEYWGRLNNIDPRLMVAIAGAESTLGKNGSCATQRQNAWGYGGGWPNCWNFPTWDEGIRQTTWQILNYRNARGLTTIHAIGQTWCGSGCGDWESNVRAFYSEQGGDPNTNSLVYPLLTILPVPTNPIQTAASLSPNNTAAGGVDLIMRVNGSNFVSPSIVRWNSIDLATTYTSDNQLIALIPSSYLASAGSANVTVINPEPGGGESTSLTFIITPADINTATVPTSTPAPSLGVGKGNYDNNDTNIVYIGKWIKQKVKGNYLNTERYSTSIGSNASLTFTGEQVSVIYRGYPNAFGDMEIKIDGTVVGIISENTPKQQMQMKWTSGNLGPGIHTLTLTHISGAYISLDGIIVGP